MSCDRLAIGVYLNLVSQVQDRSVFKIVNNSESKDPKEESFKYIYFFLKKFIYLVLLLWRIIFLESTIKFSFQTKMTKIK